VRISGFHVDGFGALADFGIEELSPGLVVLNGPNEAGKSTMLDFLTAMLFGFPSRRDNPRFRAPVRGGRHGGRLSLAEGAGRTPGPEQLWSIERYAAPHKDLSVRRPDGALASENELKRALGGADETLFRAVFAVDLTDLGSAEAMTRDEVSELLFSASIVGQRRSAARAMASLQKQRLELARARQADARANRLLAQLESVRSSLAEAARDAISYPARQAELSRLEREMVAARDEVDRIDRRTRELDLLTRLWDVLERKRSAEQRLSDWREPAPLAAWLEEQAGEIQSLRAACSGHLERVNQLSELANQRTGIEHSIEAALGCLGPSWDRDRVRASGGFIGLTDDARRFRTSIGEVEARLRAASVLAEEAESAPELTGSLGEPDYDADRSEAIQPSADDEARWVSELRRNLSEQRRLLAERQVAERGRPPARGTLAHSTGIVIAAVGALIALLGAVAALVSPVLATRVICGALAAAGSALFVFALVARRRPPERVSEATDADTVYGHVVARVAELAGALGLQAVPSESDLETAAERVEAARARERVVGEERRRLLAACERSRAAHESLALVRLDYDAEQTSFAAWKAAHGLETALSPDGVLESLATLQTAFTHLGALDRVSAKIEQLRGDLDGFQARLDKLTGDYVGRGGHLESLGADPAAILEELSRLLAELGELRSTRSSLSRVIEDAANELERSLGLGEEARRLRTELESGEVLCWREEQDALLRGRLEAREHNEATVRAHQDAANELSVLVSSGEISELEQRRLALEHELEEVLRSWAVLGCARLLLERTLRRHERERQPAVLARAGERFAKVTEGRYLSLLPSISEEAGREAIRVVSSAGTELEAAYLSRGSVEQLYLCLRIGLAETFAERCESLPLILDDVLVNFDPARAAAVAEVIAETSEHHQVLFFTCHPHLSELMVRCAPQAQVVELDRVR
jgi:uncharacterized protein YhaN